MALTDTEFNQLETTLKKMRSPFGTSKGPLLSIEDVLDILKTYVEPIPTPVEKAIAPLPPPISTIINPEPIFED